MASFMPAAPDQASEAQTCLEVDLFEVSAEHAQLDLEDETQAAEAIGLAEPAARLTASSR